MNRTRSLVITGLGIALLAVAAQLQLPIGPVPITLHSMVVTIILLVYTPQEALATLGGYLALGALGIPVGAGFRSGLAWLLGPTGGFLIGFLLAAWPVAALRHWLRDRSLSPAQATGLDIACAVLVTVCYYSLGTLWLMLSLNLPLAAALATAVLPFILPDLVKLVLAVSFAPVVRQALGRATA